MPRGSKLLDAYGEVASRWRAALDAGAELPTSWVLDKKRFRRALDEALPPGHRVSEILGDRSAPRRAAKAARAFERLLDAAGGLPLPEWPEAAGRLLLWSSPVVRPRGVQVPSLAAHFEVEPDASQVRQAVGRLWAFVYLEQTLREMAAQGVKGVDVVVGLTVLSGRSSAPPGGPGASDPPNVQSWTALLTEQEPPPSGFAMPGRSYDGAPESALAVSLGASSAQAWREALRARWGRSIASAVGVGPGRWQWNAETVLSFLQRVPASDALTLAGLLGLSPEGEGGQRRASRGAGLTRILPRELVRQSRLLAQVNAHEGFSRDALAGLVELDLAVLPDDGLKRTLEDAISLEQLTARLAVHTTLSAALLVACCEQLVPGAGLLVDAGLDALPWLALLGEWEERLEVVRHDKECRRAILGAASGTSWQSLPDGPGRRALHALAVRHGFFARRHIDPACPRLQENGADLLELARWALPAPVDVFGRCREARFAADRALAAREMERKRWLAPAFGALRALTRDAVLLRERVRLLELEVTALLRRIALDVDRRLRRLEPKLPPGAAFDCTSQELLEAVDLRGNSLAARVVWRRAEQKRSEERPEPWFPASESRKLRPIAPGSCEQAVHAAFLDGLWLLRMAYVNGVVVRWASPGDSAVALARALGVPVVSTGGRELHRGAQDAFVVADGRLNPERGEGSWR